MLSLRLSRRIWGNLRWKLISQKSISFFLRFGWFSKNFVVGHGPGESVIPSTSSLPGVRFGENHLARP
jgi:hypothetical protein